MLALDVKPIGLVRHLGDRGCLLELRPIYRDGLEGLKPGDRVQVLYWMHELAHPDRRLLRVHPGGDPQLPVRGVFALRSCRRPNPIGVSLAAVLSVEEVGVVVSGLDANEGSPIIDIKLDTSSQ